MEGVFPSWLIEGNTYVEGVFPSWLIEGKTYVSHVSRTWCSVEVVLMLALFHSLVVDNEQDAGWMSRDVS